MLRKPPPVAHQDSSEVGVDFQHLAGHHSSARATGGVEDRGVDGRSYFARCVRGYREENLSNQPEWSLLNVVVYLCDYRLVPRTLIFMPCLRTRFLSSFCSCTAPLDLIHLLFKIYFSFTYWFLKKGYARSLHHYITFFFSALASPNVSVPRTYFSKSSLRHSAAQRTISVLNMASWIRKTNGAERCLGNKLRLLDCKCPDN